jgi:hypothetical protein
MLKASRISWESKTQPLLKRSAQAYSPEQLAVLEALHMF